MQVTVEIRDTLTPHLVAAVKKLQNTTPVTRAMAAALVNMAQRAFMNPEARPIVWKTRTYSTGKPILVASGLLKRSPRVIEVKPNYALVGSDRVYAAIHQFGGVITPKTKKALKFQIGGKFVTVKKVVIPPRPFWPFIGSPDNPTPTDKAIAAMNAAAERIIQAALLP